MKKLLVAFLLTNSILFAFTDEERRFWERVNPEQLKKWEKVRSQMGSSANEDQKSKQKEDNENEIVGYLGNNLPITKADMKWRVTMNSLSASNSKEWGKVVTMPDNCKSGLDNKLYDIMAISTNILNQHPKDWLNGKYLEFINSKCYLSRIIDLRETTTEDFEKIVEKSIAKKEALLRKMKDEERNSSFINALLIILIPVIIFRLYQRDKEPRKKLPRKEKLSPFWSAFFWWSMWDNQNDKH